ncbi:MAG: hypothetical protein ABI586_02970 [Candidatus Nanopelagicales bacterium]
MGEPLVHRFVRGSVEAVQQLAGVFVRRVERRVPIRVVSVKRRQLVAPQTRSHQATLPVLSGPFDDGAHAAAGGEDHDGLVK